MNICNIPLVGVSRQSLFAGGTINVPFTKGIETALCKWDIFYADFKVILYWKGIEKLTIAGQSVVMYQFPMGKVKKDKWNIDIASEFLYQFPMGKVKF